MNIRCFVSLSCIDNSHTRCFRFLTCDEIKGIISGMSHFPPKDFNLLFEPAPDAAVDLLKRMLRFRPGLRDSSSSCISRVYFAAPRRNHSTHICSR